MKVLLFSVSIGAGHDSVANAVIEEIKSRDPDSETLMVDTFEYINPVLNKVIAESYIESLKFTPKVWGYLYKQAEESKKIGDIGQLFSRLLSPKLEKLLNDFKPDVLVCSHAFPIGILSVLKDKKKIDIPMVACITDYTVHSFWIQDNVDYYIIPADDLKYPFLKMGVVEKKIKALGIPIRKQFLEEGPQEEVRKKLELEDKATVLVMGGGLGLGNIKDITIKLLKDSLFQVIVVTGNNQKLYEELSDIQEMNYKKRLKVFGFVQDIAQIMRAADCLISKPGGITTAEALASEIPIIIYAPLPGQEDRNTDYLLNRGLGIRVRKIEELVFNLNIIFENDLRQRQIKEMAGYFKKPRAAIDTVDLLEEIIENRK